MTGADNPTPELAAALAAMHARAFNDPWPVSAFVALLSLPEARLEVAADGFILTRLAADEAEILTLAVCPTARRRGLGRRLVETAAAALAAEGATRLFLEVAEDNAAARALYAGAGFASVGRRPGYYGRPAGAVDALVLARDLAAPDGTAI
ncbi:MAG: GNAT family N-acetyltransferase [Brevundimonas sp.]|jgi:ribosomal-protein-alanine N-acetyltransferase|uniref:GNAT family N-acetyltransferase n=1 Tax=Brevundimonas sp. TaxID=1871086 RepID=UPI0022BE0250|nr:GNAT family N-acetyltransferase [Brevundimonas sp.]MCZ8193369.1 GNAT family N-acetyltransferase [Brevundimonas sp.]